MFSHRCLALGLAGFALVGCSETPESPQAPRAADVPVVPQAFPACDATFEISAPDPKLPWTPNAVRLVSKKLAPRVFAILDANADEYAPKGIPLATSGGFVVGDNGVLLVESMINRQLFCQVIGLVRAETNKPIQYVVNTSSHGDHNYGNTFLPGGVHVVQHEQTAAYIAEHFQDDVSFMKSNFGANQGLDEILPVKADLLVKDAWSVDLGGVSVEAKFHGFAQTGGDLFVSVPGASVVWTGNPIIAEKPAIPWLLDGHTEETGLTLAAVKASLPGNAIVVPGHGRVIGRDGFDFSIDYLNTLVSEVKSSVGAGMSAEQTVASVTMAPFQGYALWGWIHTQVNVPKTYGELRP